MPSFKPQVRTRYFIAGEGASEKSFIAWLQNLANSKGICAYLEGRSLNGGGYNKLLKEAVHQRKGKFAYSFLIVDSDRADRGDCPGDYSLKELMLEAAGHEIDVCVLKPNLEGLYLRMILNKKKLKIEESSLSSPSEVKRLMTDHWPAYKKPADALTLAQKFSLTDLHRAASHYKDLNNLFIRIGLITE